MKKNFIINALILPLLLLLPGCKNTPSGTMPSPIMPEAPTPTTVSPVIPFTPQPSDTNNGRGKWVVGDHDPVDVSPTPDEYTLSDIYNGKAKTEYEAAAGGTPLVWGEQMFSSPDGEYVMFNSNRNCLDSGGMSIFLLNCSTGEECLLIDGTDGYYYSILGWWLNEHTAVIQRDKDDSRDYIICHLDGVQVLIDMETDFPTIVTFRENAVIFTTEPNSNSVSYGLLNSDGTIREVTSFTPATGYLMGEYAIAPDLKNVALKIRDSYESTDRNVLIWAVTSGISRTLPQPEIDNAEDIAAIDLNWGAANLSVNFSITVNGVDSSRTFDWVNDPT